ncbi:hypothetical protein L211DRAFT_835879 [Terfezia boudieri ATCC MYA-4762]|uniref:MMS19 nucleotide excision repair protein n=1 Tax=Terfezia boudieri ATCC MYA-4762 TaxID=1051890 RepID=A0A3N4LSM8_9PEZI|nr:hypothetical protein L211DRAFT_835879 [Terfezia boudieri ATCC MYA-4762]
MPWEAEGRRGKYRVPWEAEGRNAVSTGRQNSFLVALSNILRHIPSKIFLPSLPQLVPLLLQSLDLPTPAKDQGAVNVKLATLSTLSITILESANALQAHVSSLITYHGDLGNPGAPRRVTKEALSCLRIFPGTLRNELVLPYKSRL